MDGLLVILIIWGIISSLNKKKKQQEAARKAQMQAEAFDQAFPEERQEVKKPVPANRAPEVVKKVERAVKEAVQQEIPFTKEEWARFLGEIEGAKAAAKPAGDVLSKAKPAAGLPPKARLSSQSRLPEPQPLAEGISAPLKSTQGESEDEHRRHQEKIAAEEKRMRERAEDIRSLRSMNRRKLRQAVIMSEVLGKPAALRKRG